MQPDKRNHFVAMARYNSWMNQKIYAACDKLDDATRKKDMGAFFGSLHRTLDHILYGDTAWLERLRDNRFTPRDINKTMYQDWEQLKVARFAMDQEIEGWIDKLDVSMLDEEFSFTSNVDNKTRVLPRRVLVQHLFNHQTHHRGQVTTLLSQLGIDIGPTDLPFMPGFAK